MAFDKARVRSILFLLGDFFSLFFGFIFVFALRKRTPFFPPLQDLSFYFSFLWVYVFSFIGFFFAFRLYDGRRPQFSLSHLSDYLKALFAWAFIIIGFAFAAQANYSRVLLLYSVVPGFIFPFIIRLLVVRFLPQVMPHSEYREISQSALDLIRGQDFTKENLDRLEGLEAPHIDPPFSIFLKRVFDLIVSFLGLVFLFLLFPFFALLIRFDSSGKILLAQKRVGFRGRQFTMYKFRTMYSDALLYAEAPQGNNDSRVTRAGRFLRRYSLDELPQLWNVFKGEMSIVGPRPEMPFLVERYNEWQRQRLLVKPGITGLWQILGRKDLPLSENLEYDFYYIHHRSFLLDLVIILKTIPAIILAKGAY